MSADLLDVVAGWFGGDAEVGKSKKAKAEEKRRAEKKRQLEKQRKLRAQGQGMHHMAQPTPPADGMDQMDQMDGSGSGDVTFPDEGSEAIAVGAGDVEFQDHEQVGADSDALQFGAGDMVGDVVGVAYDENAVDRAFVGTSVLPTGWVGKWLTHPASGGNPAGFWKVTRVFVKNEVAMVELMRQGASRPEAKTAKSIVDSLTAGWLVWSAAPATKQTTKFAQVTRMMR